MAIAHKELEINHVRGPLGVRGRNSYNNLIHRRLMRKATMRLWEGLLLTGGSHGGCSGSAMLRWVLAASAANS